MSIDRRANNYLNAGVSEGQEILLERVSQAVRVINGLPAVDLSADLKIYTADSYGKPRRKTVSIEEHAERTLEIQEALDCQVVAENQNVDSDQLRVDGLPPCKRVGLKD